MSEETRAMPEKALLVLRAAAADAGGELGVHVSRARVMQQTGISDLEEFVRLAQYLAERGYIAEGVNRYELFVLTLRGIGVSAGGMQHPRDTPPPTRAGCNPTYTRYKVLELLRVILAGRAGNAPDPVCLCGRISTGFREESP